MSGSATIQQLQNIIRSNDFLLDYPSFYDRFQVRLIIASNPNAFIIEESRGSVLDVGELLDGVAEYGVVYVPPRRAVDNLGDVNLRLILPQTANYWQVVNRLRLLADCLATTLDSHTEVSPAASLPSYTITDNDHPSVAALSIHLAIVDLGRDFERQWLWVPGTIPTGNSFQALRLTDATSAVHITLLKKILAKVNDTLTPRQVEIRIGRVSRQMPPGRKVSILNWLTEAVSGDPCSNGEYPFP